MLGQRLPLVFYSDAPTGMQVGGSVCRVLGAEQTPVERIHAHPVCLHCWSRWSWLSREAARSAICPRCFCQKTPRVAPSTRQCSVHVHPAEIPWSHWQPLLSRMAPAFPAVDWGSSSPDDSHHYSTRRLYLVVELARTGVGSPLLLCLPPSGWHDRCGRSEVASVASCSPWVSKPFSLYGFGSVSMQAV